MQTSERIISQAAQLFAERGFEAVSMRDIASASGIKAPSLYNHFSDKKTLYQTVLKNVFKQHNTQLMDVFSSPQDAPAKLQKIIHISFATMSQDSTFRQLIQRELLNNDKTGQQFLAQEVMQDTCIHLAEVVQQINPESDHHYSITSVMGLILFHAQIAPMREFLPGSDARHTDENYLAEQTYQVIFKYLSS